MSNKGKAKLMGLVAGGMMVLSTLGCVDGGDVVKEAGQTVETAVNGVKDVVNATWENGCNTGAANPGGCVLKDVLGK